MAMDLSKICRICLEANKQAFDIYTSYYLKRNTLYSEMLSSCTKLKLNKDDGLPHLICKECSRQLKRTYAFNLQCEESDKKLKNLMSNCEPEVQAEENGVKTENKLVNGGEGADEVKNEGAGHADESLFSILGQNAVDALKNEIKVEPTFTDDGNDSCWDEDDDNLMLEEIKGKKALLNGDSNKDNIENCLESNDGVILKKSKPKKSIKLPVTGDSVDKPKKKRGRKKILPFDPAIIQMSNCPHQCDICGKFLSTKSNLKAHKVCHTDQRPYKCTECPAAFRGHSALFQHKKVHSGETPYHCEYCPKQFSRRTGLVNHIRMHTGEKLYSCDVCFKRFVQSAQLSIHLKRHKGEKSYLCQECGKGFPVKADLRVHQRIHNGEKPYSCHLCAKTFATSGNLAIHVRIHNKEVRYKCEVCQRGFITCSAYNVHLKRHKGQRDYHCECGKTFYTSSALKQHKVVHTGEKKYQCKICERKFSQTSHLSRHFKRDHASPYEPLPSIQHYKVVLQGDKSFSLIDDAVHKLAQNVGSDVKCEGS